MDIDFTIHRRPFLYRVHVVQGFLVRVGDRIQNRYFRAKWRLGRLRAWLL